MDFKKTYKSRIKSEKTVFQNFEINFWPWFVGTVSQDILLLVFLWISFPPAPEYPNRTVSNFFQNSRRYSQVKVHYRYQWHQWQICHRYWQSWQIVGKKSGCWDLRVNLKAKICKLIIKTFMIEDYFHLPLVSMTPVVHIELRISPPIFEKIRNGPNSILRGLGETDSWKNHKSKISWDRPFKPTASKWQD